jgi:hypothetical protein
MRSVVSGIRHELGTGRALANVRADVAELERALASVDALAARLAARTVYERAA